MGLCVYSPITYSTVLQSMGLQPGQDEVPVPGQLMLMPRRGAYGFCAPGS